MQNGMTHYSHPHDAVDQACPPVRTRTVMGDDEPPPTRRSRRRDEHARQTREAVVDAARRLFAERGFTATTVDEIAASSRVSAGTVYQQCGGKRGLLSTLVELWAAAPLMSEAARRIEMSSSGLEIVDFLADAYLQTYRTFGDLVALCTAIAPHDEESARWLHDTTRRDRHVLVGAAERLRELGALPDGTTSDHFADVATFYFGSHGGIRYLVDDLGWTPDAARSWIRLQLTQAVGLSLDEDCRPGPAR